MGAASSIEGSLPKSVDEATAKAAAGDWFDGTAFKGRATDGVLRFPTDVKWDGVIDTKQADSTPAMLEQVINNLRGGKKKSMLRYHYTTLKAATLIAYMGFKVGSQGKAGNGLFFFTKGPHEYPGHPYHGMSKYPAEFEAFAKQLTEDGRGGTYDPAESRGWMQVCLVCFVGSETELQEVKGRPNAEVIPLSFLRDVEGFEDGYLQRGEDGDKIVQILGAIQVLYEDSVVPGCVTPAASASASGAVVTQPGTTLSS